MLQWYPRLVRLILFAVLIASFVASFKPLNFSWQ
jgi:hypothetical protein